MTILRREIGFWEMRKLIKILATACVLASATSFTAVAAPVPGYEGAYGALIEGCTLPSGTVDICETGINEYSAVLVGAVDLSVANASFTEARGEVFVANEADQAFQAAIDALFELLLPDSGAVLGLNAVSVSPN